MDLIKKAQRAVCGENLDGWLFFNFHGRDGISNRLLGLKQGALNSRPWFCILPTQGEPIKIVHTIERGILDTVPGETYVYSSRQDLTNLLKPLAGTYAAQVSENITVISTLDHGTARYLEGLGFNLTDSAVLIQKTIGVLSEEGIASHERAAALLYNCIDLTWKNIKTHAAEGIQLTESRIQSWILDYFRDNNLVTDHPALVASGVHSSDPHYEVPSEGGIISPGDIIQFDIWAKENLPGAIYADISWVGVLAKTVPEELQTLFQTVTGARDRALDYISDRFEQGLPVIGADVDRVSRAYIEDAGYGTYICHRTGHGIDTEVHGSGVNMDCVEFPDHREIINGSCFSLEPGLYLERYGMRTEIDAYRKNGRLVVSGGPIQKQILTL